MRDEQCLSSTTAEPQAMQVEVFSDPSAYFDAVQPSVAGREAASALFLSIVQAEVKSHAEVPPEHFLLAVVQDGRRVAFALSTRAKSLLMCPWSEECKQQAEPICAAIACFLEAHPEHAMVLVMGTNEQANHMADAILALPSYHGRAIYQTDRLLGYQLTPATFVVREELDSLEPIHLRLGTEADAERFGVLLHQFYEDTEQMIELGKPAEMYLQEAQRHIGKGRAFFWCSEDGTDILAIVVIGEPTEIGHRINRVFTARHARRLGYARLLVTAVCRRLFQEKGCSKVLLMAEDGVEGPNQCYKSIGFQQHDVFVEVNF